MRHSILQIAISVIVIAGLSGIAEAKELRVLSAWDQNFVFNKTVLQPLLKSIEEKSGGRLTFSVSGPEVVPTFQQFEPVQSGAFDMLFAHPGYFTGNAGVGVTIDAIKPDPAERRESGVWDYLDEYYAKHGMKLIALPPQGEHALLFVVKNELPKNEKQFSGLKLRANTTYQPLVKALGGASVLMSGGEIYQALQTGVIDGAAWSVVGVTDFKLNEVANYWTEPAYGQTGTTLLMNLATWKSLSDEDRKIINEAALETEKETMVLYNELNQKEREMMKDKGMMPTHFVDEVAEDLDALWSNGVWQLGVDKAGDEAEAFRKFAESKGMTETLSSQ